MPYTVMGKKRLVFWLDMPKLTVLVGNPGYAIIGRTFQQIPASLRLYLRFRSSWRPSAVFPPDNCPISRKQLLRNMGTYRPKLSTTCFYHRFFFFGLVAPRSNGPKTNRAKKCYLQQHCQFWIASKTIKAATPRGWACLLNLTHKV